MKVYHLVYLLIFNYAIADDSIKDNKAILARNEANVAFKLKLRAASDKEAIEMRETRIHALDWTTKLTQEESYKRYENVRTTLGILVNSNSKIVFEFKDYMECLPDVPWSKNVPFSYNSVYGYHKYREGALQGFFLSSMAEYDPKNFEIYVRNSLANDQTSDQRKRTIALALGVGSDFFSCEEFLLQMDAEEQRQVRYSLLNLRFAHLQKWDTDNDLIVTFKEFSDAVSAKPDLLAKFKGYDLNRDGRLTKGEFLTVDQLLGRE